ncbi:hypothetical protein PHMEG_0002247 [Phytophthora megakarya]|uniref:Transmembrane protein n=1 Tax=Phytophthora megakarya TaxID=4795 RepID=A0A225WZ35_9STRA|nr:hypothetical protein PHMEG_0002247 [Phytophthora megakarya]
MSYLPNREFYPQLANMDAIGLRNTLSNVILYGFLELISIIVLEFVLRTAMKYSPVCQLGFVLQNQWKMVQSKLVLWVLYVVQSSLVHFGRGKKKSTEMNVVLLDNVLKRNGEEYFHDKIMKLSFMEKMTRQ